MKFLIINLCLLFSIQAFSLTDFNGAPETQGANTTLAHGDERPQCPSCNACMGDEGNVCGDQSPQALRLRAKLLVDGGATDDKPEPSGSNTSAK